MPQNMADVLAVLPDKLQMAELSWQALLKFLLECSEALVGEDHEVSTFYHTHHGRPLQGHRGEENPRQR